MAQSSILGFVRKPAKAAVDCTPAEERRKRQREQAEELGFTWPLRFPKKGPGRPSHTDQYLLALLEAIQSANVPDGATRECPDWWRPGSESHK